jgi:hypothetical protein
MHRVEVQSRRSNSRPRTLLQRATSPTDRHLCVPDSCDLFHEREISATDVRLSFSSQVRIVLVPSRQDYRACGIDSDLWWQPAEYLHFKSEAKAEVSTVMQSQSVCVKTALDMLYQCSLPTEQHFPLLVAGSPSPTAVTAPALAMDFVPIHSHASSPGKKRCDLPLVHPLAVLGAI